ncbi:hypothetical protein CKO12_08445 [Chromatium okenii]|uniref:DUF5610 domain-containing protein n=1 Tax=Chromatium okenii TaxID=61644 RepID=UPI001903007F|nr:DUF5610 domain-containing protein [Chromatium okenii]MBK1641899.1 hypothetical protein [Chromatium okenii]
MSITLQSYAAFSAQQSALKPAQSDANSAPNWGQSERALARVQDVTLKALAQEIPGMDVNTLKKRDQQEYTPDKIANRIGTFVARGLENARAQGKSDEEVQALYDSAVRGVERGFKEAKTILENLNLLNGGISEQVQATEDATFATLRQLAPSSTLAGLDTGASAVGAAQRYQKAEDFQLSLRTKDGDTVKVSFSRALDAQVSLGVAADGKGNQALALDVSRSSSTGYQFTVEGNLDAEELEAMQTLVRDVSAVANQFFNGDVQQAFAQAPDIRFDDSQLASMQLRLSRSEQSTAVAQYQQTQQLEPSPQVGAGRRLGQMARDLNDAALAPAAQFLEQARTAVNQIMEGLVRQDQRFQTASADQQTTYQNNLARLLGIPEFSAT